MNKSVILFIKKLAIFIVVFFILDRAIGYAVQFLYFSKKDGNSAVTSYAILKTHEDLLIYGSSRAAHHYDCAVLTDSLGFSSYNCGKDGANIIYAETILPTALERHKPKAIILDLIANDLAADNSGGAENRRNEMMTSVLLPYVHKSKQMEEAVYEINPYEVYKAKLSWMYAYNSVILQVFANKLGAAHKVINGFQPLKGSKVSIDFPVYDDYSPVDSFTQRKFEEFIQTAKSQNIPLYVVISPMYFEPFKPTPTVDSVKNILARYNLSLWDYSQDSIYKRKEYFYDNGHMNLKGAEAFSAALASRIKQDMQRGPVNEISKN